jgi:hypothetical protein
VLGPRSRHELDPVGHAAPLRQPAGVRQRLEVDVDPRAPGGRRQLQRRQQQVRPPAPHVEDVGRRRPSPDGEGREAPGALDGQWGEDDEVLVQGRQGVGRPPHPVTAGTRGDGFPEAGLGRVSHVPPVRGEIMPGWRLGVC